jgi:hypothetical protein
MKPKITQVLFVSLTAAAFVAGCASQPPPVEQMATSRSTLEEAQRAGANEHAPVELRDAQQKYAAANAAMGRKDYDQARRLATEAAADARLAGAKAQTARAQAAVAEVNKGLDTLRSELQKKPN